MYCARNDDNHEADDLCVVNTHVLNSTRHVLGGHLALSESFFSYCIHRNVDGWARAYGGYKSCDN